MNFCFTTHHSGFVEHPTEESAIRCPILEKKFCDALESAVPERILQMAATNKSPNDQLRMCNCKNRKSAENPPARKRHEHSRRTHRYIRNASLVCALPMFTGRLTRIAADSQGNHQKFCLACKAHKYSQFIRQDQ